jgi:hypothetical protein|tara:strand:- start:787 stop:1170 length:384 start_codon:yes stop_codon:yes gene_type:complete
MAAGKYTFIIEQGATTDFEVVWKDGAGTPINLSSYQARMQIRSGYGSSATLYANLSSSLDADGTGLNLSGSNGLNPLSSGSIGIFISAASSSNFTFGEARYDLEMVSGSYVTRLLEGKVKLSKEVTV